MQLWHHFHLAQYGVVSTAVFLLNYTSILFKCFT
uniref:Uncharacterized protein n=1 Tax=Anguilla anguilla TaxID=7936 RepID=A0A0E9XBY0_ANGAN